MRQQYPLQNAFDSFRLPVGDGHTLFVEQAGNPEGTPVIFFHGGPGGGIDPAHRRYFNPDRYRIVLFDQRGSGRSTPHAKLEHNTTWDLIADAECIRERLGIEKWQVFGGSWGSTLALAYAVTHPDRVTSVVLRGIFLIRELEVNWFYQSGASELFPDRFEHFREHIPKTDQHDLVTAYHRLLTDDDADVRLEAARQWAMWEGATSRLILDENLVQRCGAAAFALSLARIEVHYFVNQGFFEEDGWLLTQIDKIRHIPCTIVQGRYDVVCPVRSAWDLKKAWPEADLRIIPDAGHASSEPGIVDALIETTDKYAHLR
ncbi:MAG: prolyl aminopeptidase [Deltaproteobacteria bacterium]|nr:prolyl aminopeptidase [Deltaproteobacteria bacterium]